jgi:hypothetical protein
VHVESAAIYAIDYDTRRRRLHVPFVSGQRYAYAYAQVPGPVHRAFLEAESKGHFFQAHKVRLRGALPLRRSCPRQQRPAARKLQTKKPGSPLSRGRAAGRIAYLPVLRSRLARPRRRNALSLMKPAASRWS